MKSMTKTLLFLTIIVMGASCIKEVDYNEGIANNEKTLIKLPQASEKLWPFALDAKPGIITLDVLEVRRDAISNADLNQALKVKIAPNNTAIANYNAVPANSANPLTLFTNYTLDPSVTQEAGNWVLNFAPGEFVKFIKIKLDPSTLDFSKRNALAFKTVDAGGAQISAAANEVLVEIAVKNKYDGVYKLEGTMVDYASAAITGLYPVEIALITTGSNTVKMYDYYWPGDFHPIQSGGARSVYGAFSPLFKFDENDNVIEVGNSYGVVSNTRAGQLDPTGVNKYNPATKKLTVKYRMLQPSVITAPPNIRVLFDETMTYVRSR